MRPDWLGSPQHIVAGLVLAFLAMRVGRRWIEPVGVRVVFAAGVTALGEVIVELAEWRLFYFDYIRPSGYYDTVADLGTSLVGAALGIAAALVRERR